jgi:signal transduction histidine kinase/CheY-like chemotaxis protein
MLRLGHMPIRRKLIVLGVATSACALLVITTVFLVTTFILVRRSVHQDLTAQSAIVADNSTAALAFDDRVAATETLQALAAKPSIDLACVYDRDRGLFAEGRFRDNGCPDRAPADVDALTLTAVRIARPVMVGTRRVGTLYLLGNLDEVWRQLAIQAAAALFGIVLATIAAFVIARRLQAVIARPVVTLSEAADTIARGGDYSLRVPREGSDEVGSLVDAFNEMVAQVQRREGERIALLRREQEANRLKDEFLAALSHELRTPLNAILGWIQILRSMPPSPATIERALASLERNARAQTRLIEDLLDVSRIISGKMHLNVAEVDFTAVVESALDVIRPAAQAKQITMAVDVGPAACHVTGDADRLRQVVWNLLSNAVKFTPHGGRVEVTVSASPATCELIVRDNGVGIAPEFLPYVFDRFRQADGSMTRQHGGLGLGLAIVREVTQAHGGQVRVESTGAGQGTTFTLSLPALPPAAGASAGDREAPRAARLDHCCVLVVDDEEDAREVTRLALESAGADVDVADSGAAALARTAVRQFDVLVCDIAMPGLDGYALLRQIRARDVPAGRFTPAVAVSAFADRDAQRRALDAGYQRFVAKPYDFAELVAAVDSLVQSRPNRV